MEVGMDKASLAACSLQLHHRATTHDPPEEWQGTPDLIVSQQEDKVWLWAARHDHTQERGDCPQTHPVCVSDHH
jgi:hypothetical protein